MLDDLDVLDVLYLLRTEQITATEAASAGWSALELGMEAMYVLAEKHAGSEHLVHEAPAWVH